MMPDLVEQRPEKGAEGDHALLPGGAHPERDEGRVRGAPGRLVEAVQLAPARVRPRRQHLDAHRRQVEGAGEVRGQALGRGLGRRALAAFERARQLAHEGPERLGPRQRHLRDGVTLQIDGLLAAREPLEIGERHGADGCYRPRLPRSRRGQRPRLSACASLRGPGAHRVHEPRCRIVAGEVERAHAQPLGRGDVLRSVVDEQRLARVRAQARQAQLEDPSDPAWRGRPRTTPPPRRTIRSRGRSARRRAMVSGTPFERKAVRPPPARNERARSHTSSRYSAHEDTSMSMSRSIIGRGTSPAGRPTASATRRQ